jgi:predicted dehydrogenase
MDHRGGRSDVMKTLKLGYVGCGFMAQRVHMPNIKATDGCELVALAEPRSELAEKVARRHQVKKVYRDHRELGRDPDVEAACLSLPFAIQGDAAADLLEAGKSVFMEKPMAVSTRQAERILNAQSRSGKRLMVGYMKRYDPGNELVERLVSRWRQNGEMGKVTYVRNHGFCGQWLVALDSPFDTTDEPMPSAPAGAMAQAIPDWLPQDLIERYIGYLQQYTHNVNLVRYFLGGAEGVQVKHVDLDEGGIDGILLLDVGGVRTVIESGRLRYHRWEENTQIYFDNGWIRTEAPPLMLRNQPAVVEVYRAGDPPEKKFLYADWEWSYMREIRHFVHCVATGEPFRSPAEDAAVDVKVFEDVFRRIVDRRSR